MLKSIIKSILRHTPFVNKVYAQLVSQGAYSPGHYHSPIPTREEAYAYLSDHTQLDQSIPEIDFGLDAQFRLLEEYQTYYESLPFSKDQSAEHRYFYDQMWFSYSDAIFLHCFLRRNQPKRIIEVGSGYSSAVILDTLDTCSIHPAEVTLIEPNPDRLEVLLRDSDKSKVRVITQNVQDVSLDIFKELEAGDLLFIDSSHVMKCGSDLQRIMFEILPVLPVGVFVHFHDVFYPFEYPLKWYEAGIFWNENYMLRSFLAYNSSWKIRFFNHHVGHVFKDYLAENMPLCLKNTGGSLYIQKVQ